MQSTTLNFEIVYNGKEFHVSFESESRERNLIMSIVTDNLPIDTIALVDYNAELNQAIVNAVTHNAKYHWNKIEQVPFAARAINNIFSHFKAAL